MSHLQFTIRPECLASLPKGDSYFAKAKRATIIDKDLAKAEEYYKLAIKNKERIFSAIKDLSTILNQQGRSSEAVELLQKHRNIFKKDGEKIDHLISNFKKDFDSVRNCHNKILILLNVSYGTTQETIMSLFSNTSRIENVEFIEGDSARKLLQSCEPLSGRLFELPSLITDRVCLLRFDTNSAARRTLDTLKETTKYQFYWMNESGKIVRSAKPWVKNLKKEESTDTSDSQSDSFEMPKEPNHYYFWGNVVYPMIEENHLAELFEDAKYCGSPSKISTIWDKVEEKQNDLKKIISHDPDYVNKLVKKAILDGSLKNH
jgi:tetratricopeptide (TPR) repeat protein